MTVARILTVVSVAFSTVLLSGANAMAATPATWGDPETTSKLFILGLLVGAPVALFLAIWVLAAAINLKAKHYSPEIPSTEVEVSAH